MVSWASRLAIMMESEQVQRYLIVTYDKTRLCEGESNADENAQDSGVGDLVNESVLIRCEHWGQSRSGKARSADVLS